MLVRYNVIIEQKGVYNFVEFSGLLICYHRLVSYFDA